MPKYLIPLTILITPLLVTTLGGCAELDELSRQLSGEPAKPLVAPSSSKPAQVTAKRFVVGDCDYVSDRSICVNDEYGLYYSDNTYATVNKETYEKANIGDPKP